MSCTPKMYSSPTESQFSREILSLVACTVAVFGLTVIGEVMYCFPYTNKEPLGDHRVTRSLAKFLCCFTANHMNRERNNNSCELTHDFLNIEMNIVIFI